MSTLIYCLVTSRLNYGNILSVGQPLKKHSKMLSGAKRRRQIADLHIISDFFRAYLLISGLNARKPWGIMPCMAPITCPGITLGTITGIV